MSLKFKKIICSLTLLLMFIVFTIMVRHYSKHFLFIITIIFLCYPIYNLLCNNNLFNNRVNALINIIVLFIGNIAAYFILVDKYVIVNHATAFISENKVSIIKEKLEDINKTYS